MKTVTRRTVTLGVTLFPLIAVQAALAETEAPAAITDGNSFDAMIAAAKGPVAVDLWAVWCGPCKKFAPVFDAVASSGKYADVSFARLDVGPVSGPLWQSATKRYGFTYIPAVLLFGAGGKWVATASGGVSTWGEWKLKDWLNWKLPEARPR